jgi:hypothetical protein
MSFHFRHDGLYIDGMLFTGVKGITDMRKDVANHIKAMLGM